MSIKDSIALQNAATKRLRSIGPKGAAKRPRQSTLKQIDMALDIQLKEILAALHDGQRQIPPSWQRGYNAAMSQVANYKEAPSKHRPLACENLTRLQLLHRLVDAADIDEEVSVLDPVAGKGGLLSLVPNRLRLHAYEQCPMRLQILINGYAFNQVRQVDIRGLEPERYFKRILFVAPQTATDAGNVIQSAQKHLAADGKLVCIIRDSSAAYLAVAITDNTISHPFKCDDGLTYRILTIET